MRLVAIRLHLVSLPLRRAHVWRSLQGSIGSYVLVEIESADGCVGWGEASALASWGGDFGRHYGESPGIVVEVIRSLIGPCMVGSEFATRSEVLAAVEGSVRGHPYAKAAVECALQDLYARTLNVPVHELFGGRRRRRVPLAHSIGLMTDDLAMAEARAAVEEGIQALKVKAGVDPERDVRLLQRLFAEFGSDVDMAVDANQGWLTACEAERVLGRLADIPLRYVEQPVEGIRQLSLLAPRVSVPLMADESVWDEADMAEIGSGGAIPLASVYVAKAGGLSRAARVDAVADAFGIGTNVNGSGETGVGNLASLHLAATMASLRECSTIPVSRRAGDEPTRIAGAMYTDDVLVGSMVYEDGCLVVPDGPGWGIEVDRGKLERYRTGYWEFSSERGEGA